MMNNIILNDREIRSHLIQEGLKTYSIIVSVKSNIVGSHKNLKEAYILRNLFTAILQHTYPNIINQSYESNDGPYTLFYFMDGNANMIKQRMIALEENHPLGRLMDLDVYSNEWIVAKRRTFRRCYLCEKDAIICMRLKSHTEVEILTYIQNQVTNYFVRVTIDGVDQAMKQELNLDPKFGLVTPLSQGSHPDMDYEMMLHSQNILLPYFQKMFLCGYQETELSVMYQELLKIGQECELAMLKASHGINTYKGLIFIMSLLLSSFAHSLTQPFDVNKILEKAKALATLKFHQPTAYQTFGEMAYQNQQFGGIRKESLDGFPSILEGLKKLESYPNINEESLTMTLIRLIVISEDSVLLKRCHSLFQYQAIKQQFNSITTYQKEQISNITKQCIKENVSFGGSADLLIAVLFIHYLKEIFI